MSVSTNERDLSKYAIAIQQLEQGRLNAAGACTLAVNAAATTVSAPTCAATSKVFLFPTTAHAAAELGNGTLYVSVVSNGAFTLAHAVNVQADRSFAFVCLG
jgi:hypothetical protein